MTPKVPHSDPEQTGIHTFVIRVITIVFVAELLIMFALPFIDLPESILLEAFLDAVAISLISAIGLVIWYKLPIEMASASSVGIRFLVYAVPVTVMLILLTVINISTLSQKVIEHHLAELDHSVDKYQSHLDFMMTSLSQDTSFILRFLKKQNTDSINKYFDTPTIKQHLKAFKETRDNYYQIRILDAQGMERVRLDTDKLTGSCKISSSLQDKSDRYYFIEGMKLKDNQAYVSPIDLNVEQGEIETPFNPMLRLVAPLYIEGKIHSLIIINYLASELVNTDHIDHRDTSHDLMIVNSNGYYLANANEQKNWGWQAPGRNNEKFSNDYSEAWKSIGSTKPTFTSSDDTFFKFWTILLQDSSGSLQLVNNSELYLVYAETEQVRKHLTSGIFLKQFNYFLLFYPLVLIAIWIYASLKNRHQQAQKELENYSTNLEKLVEERTSELNKAKNQAEKANMAKTHFLSNISHELRTPMHSILSFTDLALKRVEDEKAFKFLGNIKSSGNRLMSLLNNLLDLTKLQANKDTLDYELVNLTELIEESLNTLSSQINEKNLDVIIHSSETHEARIDKSLIKQVIDNLLQNAIKYSSANKKIKIQIDCEQSDNCILAVKDQGVGIPSDDIESIFDSFTQSSKTRSSAGGTGLGLAICKEIIKMHNGTLSAISPVNDPELNGDGIYGSEFRISIPRV